MRILLMEDDFVLGETLEEILQEAGYEVDWVTEGQSAADMSFEKRYDLYVLDINVPEINGLELLESLRDAGDETPVIYVSAMNDLSTITKGFALGAEDYLKKPFFPEELLVRIEAKFAKRQQGIHHGIIDYNPVTREVRRNGQFLSLGEVQLPLLELFIRNIGKTLTKETLFDVMEHPSDTALRVAINKLKQTTEWEIANVRGIGYRLEAR